MEIKYVDYKIPRRKGEQYGHLQRYSENVGICSLGKHQKTIIVKKNNNNNQTR